MSSMAEDPRLVALRSDFDQSFAEPHIEASRDVVDLLEIRIHGDRFAIHLEETALLLSSPTIVEMPSRAEAFVGLTGLRGNVVPVFCLATLLGYADHGTTASWLVVARDREPVGFSFGELEGHQRVESASIRRPHASETRNGVSAEMAGNRPVIALYRLLARIREGTRVPTHQRGALKT